MAKPPVTPLVPWTLQATNPRMDQSHKASVRGVLAAGLASIDVLNYQGAFKIPKGTIGASTASFSYGALAFNPDNNSIFLAGHNLQGSVAEFPIPALVNSVNLADLNTASSALQTFSNVIDKATNDDYGEGNVISGLHYNSGKLLVDIYSFYDQSPYSSTNTLILEDADNLASTAVNGYFQMDGRSYASGWISPIPSNLQSDLGGTHITGWTGSTARAIIHNSNIGPGAFSFNADSDLLNSSTITDIATNELMLNTWGDLVADDSALYSAGQVWTHASECSYGIIIPGTDTYLCMGMSGGHAGGMSYGVPPYGGNQGHYTNIESDKSAYYWAFDVNDLIAVKAGTKDSGSVIPYAHGVLPVPFQGGGVKRVSGGTFDEATGTMYLTIFQAGDEWTPVIVAYKFGGS